MSNILVTGAAGFIGSHFIDYISHHEKMSNSEIIAFDKLTYASNINHLQKQIDSQRITFVEGDICDTDLLEKCIKDVRIIINFAAESHVDNSIANSKEFIDSNIKGVDVISRLASKHDLELIQISTDEVYGSITTGEAYEGDHLSPSSMYSASKASADLIVGSYVSTFKLNAKITRSCNNFGARQHREKLIPKTIIAAFKNEPIQIYGDGLNMREWIHVDNNVRGIFDVLDKGEKGEIYNIGSGLRVSNLDIVKKIIEYTNSRSEIIFIEDRKGHDFRYAINSDKLEKISKYNSEVDFSKKIEETIDWYYYDLNGSSNFTSDI